MSSSGAHVSQANNGTYLTPAAASHGKLGGGARIDEELADDIRYFARTNEVAELQAVVSEVTSKFNITGADVIALAFDEESGNGCVHMAAGNGHVETLEYLIALLGSNASSQEAHISNDASASSSTPSLLHWPNRAGNTPLHYAAVNGQLTLVKLLINAGAEPQARNAAGHLPVFEAEQAGREEVAGYLLSLGQKGDEEKVEGAQEADGESNANGSGKAEEQPEEPNVEMSG